jgi:phenylalanyl-tRNA synthetase alpha subunit
MFTLLLSARHFIGFASYLVNSDYTVLFCCSGEWKEIEFKEYNYSAKGQPLEGGSLHPLLKARRCFPNSF